ncbi:MAG: M48 family metallopeptidase, partial [Alphaproteobacteria bacterium]
RRGLSNITIRPKLNPKREIVISKPWLVSEKHALNFLESKRRWIENIYKCAPKKITLKSGDIVEFLGMSVLLIHKPETRLNKFEVLNEGQNVLYVGGDADMFEHRVRDFIKSELLKKIKDIIRTTPSELWPKRIALRDTSSRWGSCSSSGTMSFSWRLAFAPMDILRYVVIHEVSHVKYMNHSPEFWAFVSKLYGPGVGRARRWLNQNGSGLYCYL